MTLMEVLERVEDPRRDEGKRYGLRSLLGLIVIGKLCGHTSMAAISRFGERLCEGHRRRLGFWGDAMPTHASLCGILRQIDVDALEQSLGEVVKQSGGSGVGELLQVGVDGKTLRGSVDKDGKAVHLVSLFCHSLGGVMDQIQSEKGGGEIIAALDLLVDKDLSGLVITGDAMFTQRDLCKKITDNGGDYVFTIKGNRKKIQKDIPAVLDDERFFPLKTGV